MNLPRLKATTLFIANILSLLLISCSQQSSTNKENGTDSSGVAILLVDTDHPLSTIDENIYGQFLEHINHSVENGLYAEQVQGQGFEGKDFKRTGKRLQTDGIVNVINTAFQKGSKSIRLSPGNGTAGISQGRFYVKKDVPYKVLYGLNQKQAHTEMLLQINDKSNSEIAKATLCLIQVQNGRK